MDTISTLKLPLLPFDGYSPMQFQVWWQTVVTRLEDSVNSLNDAIAEVIAASERDAISSSRIAAIQSRLTAFNAAVAPLQDHLALVEGRIAALRSAQDQTRREVDNLEVAAWLL